MAKIETKHVATGGAAAAIALAGGLIYNFEGERSRVYRDVVGIKTYCIGETRNPDPSKVYTHQECMSLLDGRLEEFNAAIDKCIKVPLTVGQRAASLSFAYNLGAGAYCNGSVARNFNAGNPQAACDAMLLYNRAGGREIRGLTLRRQAERKVCLGG